MAVDLRQVVAGVLTVTMFVMLANMIKRDHFDSYADTFLDDASDAEFDGGISSFGKSMKDPWIDDNLDLKPCWDSSSYGDVGPSEGFVTFSLINGPEYHVSQVSDAVVVARYLGATLVIPDIRGTTAGDTRKFEEIYDVGAFMKSLNGVVKVNLHHPPSASDAAVVKLPNRATADYISEHVEPLYRARKTIRLATFFPSVNMRKSGGEGGNRIACLGMFGSLKVVPEIGETADFMMERLRALSRVSGSRFVSVDMRVEMLASKGCEGGGHGGSKSCYSPQEVAVFLRKVGFGKDTVVYVTQAKWVEELDALKDIFPRTYTKESIMEASKKAKYLNPENSELEKFLDFKICSQSDVFVPAVAGLFYANVVGQRIANGKTEILVPASIPGTSAQVTNHLSPYISKKSHVAYSCYC